MHVLSKQHHPTPQNLSWLNTELQAILKWPANFVHSLISLASLYWAPISQHASLHVPQDFCTSYSPRLLSLSYVPGFSIGQPRLPWQNTAAWEASTELHGLTVSGVKSPSSKCWLIGFEGVFWLTVTYLVAVSFPLCVPGMFRWETAQHIWTGLIPSSSHP